MKAMVINTLRKRMLYGIDEALESIVELPLEKAQCESVASYLLSKINRRKSVFKSVELLGRLSKNKEIYLMKREEILLHLTHLIFSAKRSHLHNIMNTIEKYTINEIEAINLIHAFKIRNSFDYQEDILAHLFVLLKFIKNLKIRELIFNSLLNQTHDKMWLDQIKKIEFFPRERIKLFEHLIEKLGQSNNPNGSATLYDIAEFCLTLCNQHMLEKYQKLKKKLEELRVTCPQETVPLILGCLQKLEEVKLRFQIRNVLNTQTPSEITEQILSFC